MGKKKLKKIIRIEVSLDPWCKIVIAILDIAENYTTQMQLIQSQLQSHYNGRTQHGQIHKHNKGTIITINTNTTSNTSLTST
jgi:hypothetical protein